MKQHNYSRYFRVFTDDTTVTQISTNDFVPLLPKSNNRRQITYKLAEPFFYGYFNQIKAMEMAKAGALRHINKLIDRGKAGEKALYQYRFDHFQDLTVNLVEANIQSLSL
jgi:hypothetical protein